MRDPPVLHSCIMYMHLLSIDLLVASSHFSCVSVSACAHKRVFVILYHISRVFVSNVLLVVITLCLCVYTRYRLVSVSKRLTIILCVFIIVYFLV